MRWLLATLMMFGTVTTALAASPTIERDYVCDVHIFSLIPDQGIRSVKSSGHGSVGGKGKLSLGFSHGTRKFAAIVASVIQNERFIAKVSVEPSKSDSRTRALTDKEFDLTDLQPQVVEIARDDDGRVYRLHLYPNVISRRLPRQFDAADLKLDVWKFKNSQVVLNRTDLLGEMNSFGAAIGFVDIAGVAKVEFSLLPLADAEVLGFLKDGRIEIKHDDQVLTISGVYNGLAGTVLGGGPYQLWVRWLDPSRTMEEYRVGIQNQLETIKAEVANGERESPPQRTLEYLQKAAQSDRVLMLSSGMRAPRKGELQQRK